SAKDRMRNNIPEALDRPSTRGVLAKRNVSPHVIILGRVFRKNSPQVLGVQHDQMIGALAPDRANQAFNITILPRRAERGGSVPDPHGSHASLKSNPKCSVVVAN